MMITAAIETAIEWPVNETRVRFDGRVYILRPQTNVSAQTISVECPDCSDLQDGILLINRFASAYAWAESLSIRVLTAMGSGHNEPVNLDVITDFGRHTDQFRLEYLPAVTDQRAIQALAIYREALFVNSVPYKFLGFAKILNIAHSDGSQMIRWINDSLDKVNGAAARQRLTELREIESDIGKYLYVQGRCAIAHAAIDPIIDPDLPGDERRLRKDLPLMRALAEQLIEEVLGVQTKHTWLMEPHFPMPQYIIEDKQ